MDFNAAILAHMKWKDRIRDSVNGGQAIDTAVVAKDDQCDLGRWLVSANAADKGLPEYSDLKQKHAHFHRTAADTINQLRAKPAEAGSLLGNTSPYGEASSACVLAISKLRDRVAAGK
ncbi:MAG: CZB domain-containing protein [Gemmatimonadales bacterium]